LQAALQEVQQQYKETKETLVQEREAAKKVAEIEPVIKEVPVIDTELMNKLRDENDKLKVRPEHLVDSSS
jgi:myosin V